MTRYQLDRAQYQCEWFTNWFRKVLGNYSLTSQDIASMTGLHQSTIMDYLTGVRSPSLKTFLMMIDKLGLEIDLKKKEI